MNNQEEKNSIVDKILNKIKNEKVKMKPKIYFILRTVLLVGGSLVLIFLIISLVSFIVFSLRTSGALFLPKFGSPGIKIFFMSLPWLLILIAIILTVLLEIFSKKFTFVYRQPIFYSLLIIIIITFIGSFLINKTSLHPNLFWKAQERHLPGIEMVYRDFGVPRIKDVYYGIISGITDNGFNIETPRGEVFNIIINSETRLALEVNIEEGDAVVILGKQSNSNIQAFDIHKVKKDFNLFRPQQIHDHRPLLK